MVREPLASGEMARRGREDGEAVGSGEACDRGGIPEGGMPPAIGDMERHDGREPAARGVYGLGKARDLVDPAGACEMS